MFQESGQAETVFENNGIENNLDTKITSSPYSAPMLSISSCVVAGCNSLDYGKTSCDLLNCCNHHLSINKSGSKLATPSPHPMGIVSNKLVTLLP